MSKAKKNIYIISFSFLRGGAGIAAKRLTSLLDGVKDINLIEISADNANYLHFIKRIISYSLLFLQKDNIKCKKSINIFTLKKLKLILDNNNDSDNIFHFHWINNDTLSIFNFNKIPKNSIITLHDEWFYCGIEHCYYFNEPKKEFIVGYKNKFKLIDIGYYVWKYKLKILRTRDDIIYTVPSTWLLKRAEESKILKGKKIALLHNPIDTNIFSPSPLSLNISIRNNLGIDQESIVIMFASINETKNILKGNKSLYDALFLLQKNISSHQFNKITLLTFGGKFSNKELNFKTKNIGFIEKPSRLAELYSIADMVIVPSLVESFGQVAAEAQSCGTPVIGYDNTGLTDIIVNEETGYLVKHNDSTALYNAIVKLMRLDKNKVSLMKKSARENIKSKFSHEKIKSDYLEIIYRSTSNCSN
ncbi:glycosyltransferase [Providencia alcalifaciens]